MSGLQLDFVVYLGDPDEGAEALASADALAHAEEHRDALEFPQAYGALTIRRGEEDMLPALPDPIFGLLTNVVRSVGSLIEGDSENLQWSETEHGIALVPNGDDVMISVFAGDDPYEPEEFIIEEEEMNIAEFGEQVVAMGERLEGILKKVDPDALAEDDYLKGLSEFLELSRDAVKTYKLEKQRGLRA